LITSSWDFFEKKLNSHVFTSDSKFSVQKLVREIYAENGKIYYGIPRGVFEGNRLSSILKILVPPEDSHITIPQHFCYDGGLVKSQNGDYTMVRAKNLVSEACQDAISITFDVLCPSLMSSDVVHIIADYVKLIVPCLSVFETLHSYNHNYAKSRIEPQNALVHGDYVMIDAVL